MYAHSVVHVNVCTYRLSLAYMYMSSFATDCPMYSIEYLYARARVRAQAVHIRKVRKSCDTTGHHSACPEYSIPIHPGGPSEDPNVYCELRHIVHFPIYLVHIHVHHASLMSYNKTLL